MIKLMKSLRSLARFFAKPQPEQSNINRRNDIQGLRAIAVLMVVAYHAGLPVPGGFVGVDVFFVISGFVITAMLQREWAATGRIQFKIFYLRRLKRLTPALALVMTVTAIFSSLLLSPFEVQRITAETAIGAMLLGANLVIATNTGDYFDARAEMNPLLHTWSLSVEEQFYLIFPALLAVIWLVERRITGRRVTSMLVVAFIAILSFSLAVVGSNGYELPRASYLIGFYSPFTRVWEFAVGSFIALAVPPCSTISRNLASVLGVLGTSMVMASLWLITSTTPFPGIWTVLPVTGTTLLIVAGINHSNFVTRVLSTSPLVMIGNWSYSLYLWHWPLIVFVGVLRPDSTWLLPCAAILSFIPSLASYYWIEQPIRNMPMMNRCSLGVVVLATLVLPLGIASLWLGLWVPRVETVVGTMLQKSVFLESGCQTRGPFTDELIANCTWNTNATGRPIYLVGDSNAGHFAEATIGAAELLDRPVWIFTTTSCPLIDNLALSVQEQSDFLPSRVNPRTFAHCDAYSTYTLSWLQHASPGVVIVAALDQYWWDPNISAALSGTEMVTDLGEKNAILERGLTSTTRTLMAAGHQVILVQSIPTFRNPAPIWDPRDCSMIAFINGTCSRDIPITFVDDLQFDTRITVENVARATGASILDLRDQFCHSGICSTTKNGELQYRDAAHISVSASKALAPKFAEVIEHMSEQTARLSTW